MKATEARRKSEIKFLTLEDALKSIELDAETGAISHVFYTELIPEAKEELMKLGYKLSTITDFNGMINYICYW